MSRLNSLDHFLYRRFKAKLIKKFQKRGIRRALWVVQKFFICNTKEKKDSNTTSAYGRRWHLHVNYPKTDSNKKHLNTKLFLLFATKIYKLQSINVCLIPSSLKNSPYYPNKDRYARIYSDILEKRTSSLDYKRRFYIKQKGICSICTLPLHTEATL